MQFDYLTHLKLLRDECTDDIPDIILHSSTDPGCHKVRKGWFVGVKADACNAIEKGYATEKSERLFNEILAYQNDTDFWNRLTVKDDIDMANELLSSLIDDFQKLGRTIHYFTI